MTILNNMLKKYFFVALALLAIGADAAAQSTTDASSSSSLVRRRGTERDKDASKPGVTDRMQQFYESNPTHDADLSWMRVIYRQLDLTKDQNTPLYFPEEPVDGQESLFRIIMRLLANDQLAAYEYLDGRELFTDQYRIKVRDMLDRYHIYYTDAKGSNEKHPKFNIEESDVPANEVLSYYVIERWEFDRRNNRMATRIEAICPVLHRTDDFGYDAVKYPMFWVKFDDLRPFIATQNIFLSDDNNLPTCTYDDYFQLGLYDGEIYKTRNLRNRSMAQLHPDPEDLKHAQDSIQKSLDDFGKKLWVPSLDELAAKREAEALAAANTENGEQGEAAASEPAEKKTAAVKSARGRASSAKASKSKPAKVKKAKTPKSSSSSSSSAAKSVRNRRR